MFFVRLSFVKDNVLFSTLIKEIISSRKCVRYFILFEIFTRHNIYKYFSSEIASLPSD